jgi:acyl-CoA reductase-like NAD-dependent aldehyde dehydrogenase
VALAVTAARAAFPAWARQPFAARKAIAEKFASLLEANKANDADYRPEPANRAGKRQRK